MIKSIPDSKHKLGDNVEERKNKTIGIWGFPDPLCLIERALCIGLPDQRHIILV